MSVRVKFAESWCPAKVISHYLQQLSEKEQQEARDIAERFRLDGSIAAALRHAVLAGIVFASESLNGLTTPGTGGEPFEIIEVD